MINSKFVNSPFSLLEYIHIKKKMSLIFISA